MKAILWAWAAAGLLVLAAAGARADELSTAEAELLPNLDGKTTAEVLEIAGQLEAWRKDIAALRKAVADAKSDVDDLKAASGKATDTVEAVLKIARRLQGCSPVIRDFIAFDEKMVALVKRLDRIAKMKITPDDFPDVDLDDLRAAVTALIQDKVAGELADALDKKVLDKIKSLRNPAQFARDFIEDKLKKEFLNKPYKFGDFTFRVTQQDYKVSVFSPQAKITIVVIHGDTGIEVKATGLYFKYKRGGLPEPVYDKLTFEAPGADDLLAKARDILSKKIPIGPITISDVHPITVGPGKDGKGSGIAFTIEVKPDKLAGVGLDGLPKLKASVEVDSNGNVKLKAAEATVKLDTPIALGTTGLFITTVKFGLPQEGAVSVGITVATAAGGEATLNGQLTATIAFPIATRGITIKGTLNANTFELGEVEGFINRERLSLTLTSKAVTGGTGKLTVTGNLTRDGLDADASFDALLGLLKCKGHLHLGSNGNGSFSISSPAMLGPVPAEVNLSGSFTPGFKNLVFQGAISVDLENEYLGRVTAEVDVTAQLLPKPLITASGHVGALALPRIQVGDFGQLYDELKKALAREREKLYKWLADEEHAASKYAAEREAAFKGWIFQNAKKIGLDKVSTGNPTLDKWLGDLSREGKDLGGEASHVVQEAGKGLSDFRQHVEDVLPKLGFGLTDSMPLSHAAPSFGSSGSFVRAHTDPIHKDVHKSVRAIQRRIRLGRQLAPLTKHLNQVVIHRKKSGYSGEIADLRMRTSQVLTHPDGEHDAHVTLLVQVTTFRYTITPKKGVTGRIAHTNNLYVVTISLRGLADKGGKPRVEISLPKLKALGPWDAPSLLQDELARRIEAKLGHIQLTDRFEERKLYLQNLTDEPLKVRIQLETKVGGSWRWQPAGPGPSGKVYECTVGAHKTVPAHFRSGAILTARRARIWASSPSGRIWTLHAGSDVPLVSSKDEQGHLRYYAHAMEPFRYWFSAPPLKVTTFHERLVSVRNNTKVAVLVSAAVAGRDPQGKVEWERTAQPVRIEPGNTVALRHTHGIRMRGTDLRFWAEDARKEANRWVAPWSKPLARVDAKGYSATSIGTTLVVLEPAGSKPQAGSGSSRDVTLHFAADQAMLPAVKALSLGKARQLIEAKGFKMTADRTAASATVVSQSPAPGWQPLGNVVRLTTQPPSPPSGGLVKVPRVTGKTLAAARAEAKRAGFDVRAESARGVIRQTKDKTLAGQVLVDSQNPMEGKSAPSGTTITVRLVEYRLSSGPATTRVAVPSLVNRTFAQAEAEGRKAGLKVVSAGVNRRTTKNTNWAGKTLVEKQTPTQGQQVSSGSTVTVHLAQYTLESSPMGQLVAVPSLKGKTLEAAQALARNAGLSARQGGTIVEKHTRDGSLVGKTLVESQKPPEGQRIAKGTSIEVHLARYLKASPPPPTLVEVPAVEGSTLADAEQAARRAGLQIRTAGQARIAETTDRTRAGKTLVRSQSPAARKRVARGTTVEVHLVRYVLKAPPPPTTVAVPALEGKSVAAARTESDRVGLRVTVSGTTARRTTKDRNLVNTVVVATQSPAASSRLPKGGSITVTLIRYVAPAPPPPPAGVMVPRLLGKTFQEGQEEGRRVGLVVRQQPGGVKTERTKDRARIGKTLISYQSRDPGQSVPKGTVIEVRLVRYVKAGGH